MNPAKVAAALNTLSLGIAELAEALSEGAAPVLTRPEVLPKDAAWAIEQHDEEFPPSEYEVMPVPAGPVANHELGRCPTHDQPWSVKPAGVSRTGAAYTAFFHCSEKNADGTWCAKKPLKGWADAHAGALRAAS